MATKQDEAREIRIETEIVVDAFDSAERAMGWYRYLAGHLHFPFTVRCTTQRAISPLKKGDAVEVIGMASAKLCDYDMFVMIRWQNTGGLAVPLAQLKPDGDADDATRQAVEDWLYWRKMGYEF